MEPIVLTDQSVKPTNEIVFSIIGDKSALWQKTMSYLYDNYSEISEEWKYYNDGKSWLFRVLKKKKTLFWIRVLKDTFRVGFWFGDKAETFIEQSDLSESIKNDFRNAKRFKIGRGISIIMSDYNDVENVIKLIEIKLKVK
jgi:hypothetical protein